MMPLRHIFRSLFCCWLVLFLALFGYIVFWSGPDGNHNLLSSLFTRPVSAKPVIIEQPDIVEVKREEPKPEVAVPEPVVENLWIPLERGKKGGKGHALVSGVSTLEDGSIEIMAEFSGEVPQITSFYTKKSGGLSLDLHGTWDSDPKYDHAVDSGVLSLVQIYNHPTYLRFSGVSRSRKEAAGIVVNAYHRENMLRIVFSASPKQ